jgi:CDP-diacylglycerol---glycerol-3-phosphate 3-phosphatidyltransferase
MIKNIFLLPNVITYLRIIFIPLFAYLLYIDLRFYAALSFILLFLSDYFDGYIARKTKKISDIGKIMDPIADKLLVSTALILLTLKGIPLWMVAIILAREWLITFIRILIISKKVLPADGLGKIKTIVQILAILWAIVEIPYSYFAILAAMLLTLISGIQYLLKIQKNIDPSLLNIPNIITFVRFALLPLFLILLIEQRFEIALVIFLIIAISDKIDGISARVMNQMTEFGRALDSLTDWSVFLVSFFALSIIGQMSYWIFFLVVISSLFAGYCKFKIQKKSGNILVTPIAKIAAAALYITIGSYLIDLGFKQLILIASLILVLMSIIRYFQLLHGTKTGN